MAITSENVGGNSGGTNSGYVIELILIDTKDIISITDPNYDGDPAKPFTVLNGNLGVNVDAKVFKMKFRTKSCSWSETSGKGVHGIQYNSSFSFDLPKNNAALALFFHKNRFRKWVAIWCDANGQCYITGERDFGLQISQGRQIASGTNNTSISLNCISWHQSWFLESINLDLLSLSTFNEDFTEEFDVGY
jgi:hypothetical protein